MRIAIVAALSACAGCASVGETMADKPPSAVFETAKSPTGFRDCIVLTNTFPEFAITEMGDEFLFVQTRASGQVIQAKPSGAGSEIKVWGLLGTRNVARSCL